MPGFTATAIPASSTYVRQAVKDKELLKMEQAAVYKSSPKDTVYVTADAVRSFVSGCLWLQVDLLKLVDGPRAARGP